MTDLDSPSGPLADRSSWRISRCRVTGDDWIARRSPKLEPLADFGVIDFAAARRSHSQFLCIAEAGAPGIALLLLMEAGQEYRPDVVLEMCVAVGGTAQTVSLLQSARALAGTSNLAITRFGRSLIDDLAQVER